MAVMTRSPSGLGSISLAKRRAGDRAGGRADDLPCDARVGRPRELACRLGHGRHADDELARLLLAHQQLLGALEVLVGAVAKLADERLDGEADDRGDADPEKRVRQLARRILRRADDDDRDDEDRGDADDAGGELLAGAIEREPEDREHREHCVGRERFRRRPRGEGRSRRSTRTGARSARNTAGGRHGTAIAPRMMSALRTTAATSTGRRLPLGRQRKGHEREPHRAQERGRAREEALVLERLESRLIVHVGAAERDIRRCRAATARNRPRKPSAGYSIE